jgi:hypothetical protein
MLPSELSGKYEARGTLGAGAMGTVVEAFDRMIERRVAVKLVKLPGGGDAEAEEAHARFRREAQAAGRLSHPNIVGVYDYGENADTAWIVMEMVEGGSLKSIIDRGDRMPVAEVVRLMEEILSALAYSHGRGVVHRDIKPANIMLAGDRSVKIADFGIARIENSSMTQVGTVMGTPAYMAPEQLRGEAVDARADIWAAGVVLYQLLTGEKPFEGNYTALMHRVLNTEPPPPSQLAVSAPRGFDAVLARALAKRPDDRFPSASAFAEAIRNAGSAEATGFGFGGAGKLPGLDDATMVAAPSRAPAPPPAAAPELTRPASGGTSPALIGGGLAVLVAAGAAAFFLMGKDPAPAPVASLPPAASDPATPTPPPAVTPPAVTPPALPVQAPVQAPSLPAAPPAPPPGIVTQAGPPAGPSAVAPPPPGLGVLAPQAVPPPVAAPAPPPLPVPAPVAPPLASAPLPAAQPPATQPPAAPQPAAQPAPQPAPVAAAPQPAPQPASQAAPARPAAENPPGPVIAALPTPSPSPAQPAPQPAAPLPAASPVAPRVDFRAAAQAAASAAPCSLLDGTFTDQAVSVSGVLRRGGDAQIRRVLADRGVPSSAATLSLQSFDGPYCGALDMLRQIAAPAGAAPRVQIAGTQPLQHADLLRLDVQMPDRASYLYVSYIMKSNEIVHLVPSQPQGAGARVRLGDPRPGFPGWEVDEPYGTDLIVVFASERPLFPQPRPVIESLDDYLAALGTALRDARTQNSAVAARAVVVETVQRR